jgi:hypothetical protein
MSFVCENPANAPLCRCCGKPIKKVTHTYWFGRGQRRDDDFSTEVPEKPASREEAQRLVNQKIVSLQWYDEKREWVWRATTWDGQTYVDQYFCTLRCAADLGVAVARQGWKMPAYDAALERRQGVDVD